jgi:cytochrome c peroxidase
MLAGGLCGLALLLGAGPSVSLGNDRPGLERPELDWQLPREGWMLPFKDQRPIYFVNRTQNLQEWLKLPRYWNETAEKVVDPRTGEEVTRNAVKIKVPLGLSQSPPVPVENPMTVQRWLLGKRLYFDHVLSADATVSCATCHDPRRGWTDQLPVSVGIGGKKGGVSAPTVLNSAYNLIQFWDGRAASLEEQAQGPVANPLEMVDDNPHAWYRAVERIRKKGDYVQRFKEAFGTEPTRDTVAKAIAMYERTVLSGNSVHDRADLAMRLRVAEDGGTDFTLQPQDYEGVLREAAMKKDATALAALGLDAGKPADMNRIPAVAKSISNGRALFFGKARCSNCHVGDNFTDNQFHNLGVGVGKDGQIPKGGLGRYAAQPLGHKNPELAGAFRTPTLRGLHATGPFMHDGSERTLEEIVEFYDRGGNPNEYLDPKMRDFDAEKAYTLSKRNGTEYRGPKVYLFGPDQKPVVPLKLNLTREEKADLVAFMRALHGDDVDPIIADPNRMPPSLSGRRE